MIELDLTSGKGVVIVAAVLLAILMVWAASTLLAIGFLLVAIAVLAYVVYTAGRGAHVRILRRLEGSD